MHYAQKALICIYLDWVNCYLSIPQMAHDYGVDNASMAEMIKRGRVLHEQNVEHYKKTGKQLWVIGD